MEEEIAQIIKNDTWTLVTQLEDKNIIRKKWVYQNKMNEDGEVVKNNIILVCKGYA